MKPRIALAILIGLAGMLLTLNAATPAPGEFTACGTWADRVFGPTSGSDPGACIRVLFEDVADGLSRGKSWRGTPFQLGGKTYSHGLAFNSTKHLLVHLGRPGERFTAEVEIFEPDSG